MNETIVGVIVGGIFASLGTIATLIFEFKRWKKEKKIEHLRLERDRLDTLFGVIFAKLFVSFREDRIDPEMLGDIVNRCPKEVFDSFLSLTHKWVSEPENRDKNFSRFVLDLKHFLGEYDKKIENEIS